MISGALDLSPALEDLNDTERMLIEAKLKGMTLGASAAAAGISLDEARKIIEYPHVAQALKKGREICADFSAVTRERLSSMLLNAYDHADNATEMVLSVRELAKLHGLNAPTQVNIDHTVRLKAVKSEADIRQLTLEELERIALMRGGDVLEGEFTEQRALEHAVDARALENRAGDARSSEHVKNG